MTTLLSKRRIVVYEVGDILSERDKRRMRIMIVEDEEDILNLYRDFLSNMGHNVVSCSEDANNIVTNFEKSKPDICLIDYMLGGKCAGINVATKILEKSPSTPILFATAYESLRSELIKIHEFEDKNIRILMKPTRLFEIEKSMLDMVNNQGHIITNPVDLPVSKTS